MAHAMRLHFKSLTQRIVLLSFLGITGLLLVSGSAITWAFNQSVDRSFNNYLAAYLDLLVAGTTVDYNGKAKVLPDMQLLEGLPRYWQVTSGKKHIKKSPLLADWIAVEDTSPNELQRIHVTDKNGTAIVAIQQSIIFPGNNKITYIFGVQEEIADAFLAQERQKFFQILFTVLALLAGLLLLFTYLQVHLSIAPLSKIQTALKDIRSGKKARLGNDFPKEIQVLADEVNTSLTYGQKMIERYRNFSGNLAHALKTPLSVLRNEAAKETSPLADTVKEKSQDMLALIDRNLARVKAAGTGNILGARTDVQAVAEKICRSFGKLYGKKVMFKSGEGVYFRGDEGDLYEILGNIIENACKYAASSVEVTLTQKGQVVVTVADDGKGIPVNERENVLKRGRRLDESVPGTGIGLSITQDILALYEGTLVLKDSSLGGLLVEITLPGAE